MVTIGSVDAFVLRAPIDQPVRTAFGEMDHRPALLVCIEDDIGQRGWGEVWCNFPAASADYRAGLVTRELASLLRGRQFERPDEAFDLMSARTHVLALQTGDRGAISQAIAGLDQALHDLFARIAGEPLWKRLGGNGAPVPAYASGIGPEAPAATIGEMARHGYCAFKVKLGFGDDMDLATVAAARDALPANTRLMADVNQGWTDAAHAVAMIGRLAEAGLTWLEEPMPADTPDATWRALAGLGVALAGGENAPDLATLARWRETGSLSYLQPDVGKIGGVTGIDRVLRMPSTGSPVYCPHWLGGAIGLAASAHLLAAHPGGLLEVDCNPNPLRDSLTDWNLSPDENGRIALPEGPGIGVTPDFDRLESAKVEITRVPTT